MSSRRALREMIYAVDPTCRYCGRYLSDASKATLDHLTPLSRGGTDEPQNLAVSCGRCSGHKGNLLVAEYVELLRWTLHRTELLIAGGAV